MATTIGKSMYPLGTSFNLITSMKKRYDTLQTQLATGERYGSLAEMGSNRFFDLSMRTRINKIDAYSETMKTVDLRLQVLDTTISRLDKIQTTQRTAVTAGNYGTGNINLNTTPTVAYSRLDEVMTLLNSEVAGRHLFGGSYIENKPVVSADVAINGENGRDGFRTIVGERKQADLGAAGLGRVTVGAPATNSVSLTEDGAHPFGFKLSTLSTSSANISLTQPSGAAPQSLTVSFGATLPVDGETVTIGLTLPDGTETAIVLTASANADQPGEFQIGADADATAAAFSAALTSALGSKADTELAAASVYAAADNFFNGQGQPVMRVDGPPFDSATALVAATSSNTVLWYTGEDSANARATVDAKVDDGTTINYGAQANESGILKLVRTLSAMAVETYPQGDPTSTGRFDAMASRQLSNLSESSNTSGSIKAMSVELALANTTMEYSKDRQTTYASHLENMLTDMLTVPPEEVSMEILSLKTRLEASYETTSLIAQMSLVNYLR